MGALRSCLYECEVTHHRFSPKEHRFTYRIFMMGIDLDELGTIASTPFLSVNKAGLYSVREADYLPTGEPLHNPEGAYAADGSVRLKERVVGFLQARGIDIAGGRVHLITMPRVAGYMFNPVSFYYCFDREGRPAAAIAEVTNTFREMKAYLLGASTLASTQDGATFRSRVPKHFYVSPFTDVDVAFQFRLRVPSPDLAVGIDDYTGEARTLSSVLTGRSRPLTGAALAWFTVKYPLLSLRVIALIHIHALILRMKRVPWFAKAARAGDQRSLYRPHGSIAATPPLSTP